MRTSVVGKILMALVFASVIGGISAGPALSKDDDGLSPLRGQASQQRGGHDNRDRHDNRGGHDDRGREVYRSYRYQRDPVYAPPPVIYAPEPSPGISLFFPPIFIR
ncbi:MAG: hypothetical protein WA974_05055 [Thermodesulfobacteriota bacterium]